MTEEVKVEQEVQQEQEVKEVKKELTPMEQQALEMGWRPRGEFNGTDDEFIDAKEFVRRKPLFDRLDQQGKQLKRLNEALDQLKGHYTKVQETEYKRALADLKLARKQAITDGDGDRFQAIDDRIEQVEKEAAEALKETRPAVNQPDPAEFNNWLSKNSWYQKEEAMTAYADTIGLKLKTSVDNGELTPLQVLQKVEQAVKAEFPHKFRNPNKDNAPNVGESKSTVPAKSDSLQLTEQERKIMDSFLRMKNPDGTPFMTKEKYLSDLRKMKGLA